MRQAHIHHGAAGRANIAAIDAQRDYFLATISSSQTGLLGPTGDVIGYTLYADNSTNYPITRGTAFDFARHSIIDLLGLTPVPADPNAVLVDPVDSDD